MLVFYALPLCSMYIYLELSKINSILFYSIYKINWGRFCWTCSMTLFNEVCLFTSTSVCITSPVFKESGENSLQGKGRVKIVFKEKDG